MFLQITERLNLYILNISNVNIYIKNIPLDGIAVCAVCGRQQESHGRVYIRDIHGREEHDCDAQHLWRLSLGCSYYLGPCSSRRAHHQDRVKVRKWGLLLSTTSLITQWFRHVCICVKQIEALVIYLNFCSAGKVPFLPSGGYSSELPLQGTTGKGTKAKHRAVSEF